MSSWPSPKLQPIVRNENITSIDLNDTQTKGRYKRPLQKSVHTQTIPPPKFIIERIRQSIVVDVSSRLSISSTPSNMTQVSQRGPINGQSVNMMSPSLWIDNETKPNQQDNMSKTTVLASQQQYASYHESLSGINFSDIYRSSSDAHYSMDDIDHSIAELSAALVSPSPDKSSKSDSRCSTPEPKKFKSKGKVLFEEKAKQTEARIKVMMSPIDLLDVATNNVNNDNKDKKKPLQDSNNLDNDNTINRSLSHRRATFGSPFDIDSIFHTPGSSKSSISDDFVFDDDNWMLEEFTTDIKNGLKSSSTTIKSTGLFDPKDMITNNNLTVIKHNNHPTEFSIETRKHKYNNQLKLNSLSIPPSSTVPDTPILVPAASSPGSAPALSLSSSRTQPLFLTNNNPLTISAKLTEPIAPSVSEIALTASLPPSTSLVVTAKQASKKSKRRSKNSILAASSVSALEVQEVEPPVTITSHPTSTAIITTATAAAAAASSSTSTATTATTATANLESVSFSFSLSMSLSGSDENSPIPSTPATKPTLINNQKSSLAGILLSTTGKQSQNKDNFETSGKTITSLLTSSIFETSTRTSTPDRNPLYASPDSNLGSQSNSFDLMDDWLGDFDLHHDLELQHLSSMDWITTHNTLHRKLSTPVQLEEVAANTRDIVDIFIKKYGRIKRNNDRSNSLISLTNKAGDLNEIIKSNSKSKSKIKSNNINNNKSKVFSDSKKDQCLSPRVDAMLKLGEVIQSSEVKHNNWFVTEFHRMCRESHSTMLQSLQSSQQDLLPSQESSQTSTSTGDCDGSAVDEPISEPVIQGSSCEVLNDQDGRVEGSLSPSSKSKIRGLSTASKAVTHVESSSGIGSMVVEASVTSELDDNVDERPQELLDNSNNNNTSSSTNNNKNESRDGGNNADEPENIVIRPPTTEPLSETLSPGDIWESEIDTNLFGSDWRSMVMDGSWLEYQHDIHPDKLTPFPHYHHDHHLQQQQHHQHGFHYDGSSLGCYDQNNLMVRFDHDVIHVTKSYSYELDDLIPDLCLDDFDKAGMSEVLDHSHHLHHHHHHRHPHKYGSGYDYSESESRYNLNDERKQKQYEDDVERFHFPADNRDRFLTIGAWGKYFTEYSGPSELFPIETVNLSSYNPSLSYSNIDVKKPQSNIPTGYASKSQYYTNPSSSGNGGRRESGHSPNLSHHHQYHHRSHSYQSYGQPQPPISLLEHPSQATSNGLHRSMHTLSTTTTSAPIRNEEQLMTSNQTRLITSSSSSSYMKPSLTEGLVNSMTVKRESNETYNGNRSSNQNSYDAHVGLHSDSMILQPNNHHSYDQFPTNLQSEYLEQPNKRLKQGYGDNMAMEGIQTSVVPESQRGYPTDHSGGYEGSSYRQIGQNGGSRGASARQSNPSSAFENMSRSSTTVSNSSVFQPMRVSSPYHQPSDRLSTTSVNSEPLPPMDKGYTQSHMMNMTGYHQNFPSKEADSGQSLGMMNVSQFQGARNVRDYKERGIEPAVGDRVVTANTSKRGRPKGSTKFSKKLQIQQQLQLQQQQQQQQQFQSMLHNPASRSPSTNNYRTSPVNTVYSSSPTINPQNMFSQNDHPGSSSSFPFGKPSDGPSTMSRPPPLSLPPLHPPSANSIGSYSGSGGSFNYSLNTQNQSNVLNSHQQYSDRQNISQGSSPSHSNNQQTGYTNSLSVASPVYSSDSPRLNSLHPEPSNAMSNYRSQPITSSSSTATVDVEDRKVGYIPSPQTHGDVSQMTLPQYQSTAHHTRSKSLPLPGGLISPSTNAYPPPSSPDHQTAAGHVSLIHPSAYPPKAAMSRSSSIPFSIEDMRNMTQKPAAQPQPTPQPPLTRQVSLPSQLRPTGNISHQPYPQQQQTLPLNPSSSTDQLP